MRGILPVVARSWLVAAVAIAVAGCSGSPEPSGPHLRTLDHEQNDCLGVGLDPVYLQGDPADPRIAWLETSSGRRSETIWEAGFTARFAPDLEVLDASGQVVYRAGDLIEEYCAVGSGPVLVWPPLPGT